MELDSQQELLKILQIKFDIDTVGVATFSNLNASTVSVANSVTATSFTGNCRSLTISGLKMGNAIGLISVVA